MGYLEGPIPEGGNRDSDTYDIIAAELLNVGYTLEDSYTEGLYQIRIWKSAAAINALSQDWYLAIGFTDGGQFIWFLPFEVYDSVNRLLIRASRGAHSSSFVIHSATGTAYGDIGYPATSSNWTGAAIGAAANTRLTLGVSGAGVYYISISPERVLASTSFVNSAAYHGLINPSDSLIAAQGSAPYFPVMSITGTGVAHISRLFEGLPEVSAAWGRANPSSTGVVFPPFSGDNIHGVSYPLIEVMLVTDSTASPFLMMWGTRFGHVIADRVSPVANGDRIETPGGEYVCISSTQWALVN